MTGGSRIHIGTSGWHYPGWRGSFYPEGLPPSRFFPFYAGRFRTVEVNNSFYRLPEVRTFVQWREKAPPAFRFAVKASRYITHIRKLIGVEEPLALFLSRADLLGEKLGPVLFQFPPSFDYRPGTLESFLRILPPGRRYAFEFRHPGWFARETLALLSGHGAAFCIYDFRGRTSPRDFLAGDFAYIRLHGPHETPYLGSYDDASLAEWAETVREASRRGMDTWCYFDNTDDRASAAWNALTLASMLGGGDAEAGMRDAGA